jgi:hypothetical protein
VQSDAVRTSTVTLFLSLPTKRLLKYPPRPIHEITFRCRQQDGAILVVTSPAELQEVDDPDALREYLCENASQLFNLLLQRHKIPYGSSIYVVTGAIFSATWATATHDKEMHPSHDTIVLKREVPKGKGQNPYFVWTTIGGNAQTRTQGRQAGETKDQCLFLRGFLMTASPAIWADRSKALKVPTDHSEEPNSSMDHRQGPSNSTHREEDHRGGNRSTRNVPSFSFANSPLAAAFPKAMTGGISVASMPPMAAIGSDHPSLRINNLLLDLVSVAHSYCLHVEDIEPCLFVGRQMPNMR